YNRKLEVDRGIMEVHRVEPRKWTLVATDPTARRRVLQTHLQFAVAPAVSRANGWAPFHERLVGSRYQEIEVEEPGASGRTATRSDDVERVGRSHRAGATEYGKDQRRVQRRRGALRQVTVMRRGGEND